MERKKSINRIAVALIVAFAILIALTAVITPVLARYIRRSDNVKNNFTPAAPNNPGTDNKNENICVTVEDKGYPVYVRVTIEFTWRNKDGDILYVKPTEGDDYEIELILTESGDTGWAKVEDGDFIYYYYRQPVESGGKTAPLIKSYNKLDNTDSLPNEEFTILHMELHMQTVQAIGSTDSGNVPAWKDAWNIK